MKIILKGAITLLPGKPCRFSRKDVLVSGGKIASVKDSISVGADEKIDCSKKVLMPGLINAHSHSAMSILRGVGDDLRLSEWLKNSIWPREWKMKKPQVAAGANLAIIEMIETGTTCFNDHYFNMEEIMDATISAGMRSAMGYSMINMGAYDPKEFGSRAISEIKAAKEFAKKVISKKSPLITPTINPHAPNTCSKELLEMSAKLAIELDCVLHTHAAETRQELAYTLKTYNKRPIQLLEQCGCLGKKTVLAHGVYASKSEVSLVAKSGASIAHCPVSNLKLAGGGAAPIPEFISAGANLALGTDGAASNNSLSMFESMKVGAIEQKNFRFDASAVKADDYLFMATEGGAKALGINSGAIREGALADLIMLDASSSNLVPFSNNAGWLVYAAGAQNVSDSMVGGKWLMRERKLLTINKDKALAAAQKAADSLQ